MIKAKFTRSLTVVFSPEVFQQIKELSEQRQSSMGMILREIAEEYFQKRNEPGMEGWQVFSNN